MLRLIGCPSSLLIVDNQASWGQVHGKMAKMLPLTEVCQSVFLRAPGGELLDLKSLLTHAIWHFGQHKKKRGMSSTQCEIPGPLLLLRNPSPSQTLTPRVADLAGWGF